MASIEVPGSPVVLEQVVDRDCLKRREWRELVEIYQSCPLLGYREKLFYESASRRLGQKIDDHTEDGGDFFIINDRDDRISGLVLSREYTEDSVYWLSTLLIDKKVRGCSFGSAAMFQVALRAYQLGDDTLMLKATRGTRGFYEKLGFKVDWQGDFIGMSVGTEIFLRRYCLNILDRNRRSSGQS